PSGPVATPFGPPPALAISVLLPSGAIRVTFRPEISPRITEPSAIHTGPSGKPRSRARILISGIRVPPGLGIHLLHDRRPAVEARQCRVGAFGRQHRHPADD